MSKAILVFGATGKQGRAVVQALVKHKSFSPTTYTILATTRNVDSPGAKKLTELSPAIKLVKGDLHDAPAAFKELPAKPWAVFTMTMPGKHETADGISIADQAYQAGASHFVFSSVDRGEAEGRAAPTNVPHFTTKHNVEMHIRKLQQESNGKFTYTIVRPPFFLDNLNPGFFGRVIATAWRDNVTRKLPVIYTPDIGAYAAAAILEPDSAAYRNAEINICGDSVTFDELNKKFEAKTGKPVPVTYSFFSTLLLWMVHDVNMMMKFFENPGYASKPEDSNLHPMTDLDAWLDQSDHVAKTK